jgi:N-acetylmuramoyl-L-alanine amidase
MLVLHYTGMPTAAAALARLTDAKARVSAHYLIDDDGTVWRLVAERARAWHAGESFWRGATDVNSRSIGIELANPGHEFGYRPFPERQYVALIELASDLLARHPIPPRNVVGHADVAPRRKADPGELFDWQRLAASGIGLWPEAPEAASAAPAIDLATPTAMMAALATFGYEVEDPRATLIAFQRHFRPECTDGRPDAETAARLAALLRTIGEAG